MKKLVLSFVTIVLISLQSFGQNLKEKEKGFWFVNNYMGFAVLESEDSFKINTNVYGAVLGKEFMLSKRFDLLTGVDVQRMRGNIPNSNFHLQSFTIKVPVSLSYNGTVSEKTSIQVQLGMYAGYLLKTTVEDPALDAGNIEKGLGFSFGAGTFIGFNHFVTENVGFQLGLISQGDLFHSFKEEYNTIKISDLHAVQFGILLNP